MTPARKMQKPRTKKEQKKIEEIIKQSNMAISILKQEVIAYEFSEQIILSILKQKGAPIDGNFFLTLRKGFRVKRESNYMGDLVFTFTEINGGRDERDTSKK